MAAVAEASREGEASVVLAGSELRAARNYAAAAENMSQNPIALQLRYFQTLTEIASEKQSTLLVPTEPTNMMRPLSSWDPSRAFTAGEDQEAASNPEAAALFRSFVMSNAASDQSNQ